MNKGIALLAFILIFAGVYSLLMKIGLDVPTWDRLWPAFPFAAGVALLINYVRDDEREHGHIFLGTSLVLIGLFFFFITLGDQNYDALQTWWPVFIAIGGISFLALWLAQGLRDWGALFLAIVGLTFSGVTLAVKLQALGPNTEQELKTLWPASLIIIGLLLLLRRAMQAKRAG